MAGVILIKALTVLSCTAFTGYSLESPVSEMNDPDSSKIILSGFIKNNTFFDLERNSGKTLFSALNAVAGISLDKSIKGKFRGFAEVRYSYGAQFNEALSPVVVREVFTDFNLTPSVILSAGQKIIKWGTADFTSLNSKINPVNYIARSPDREDADLGNIVASASWFAGSFFDLEAVLVPFYRPSTLLIDPVPIPQGVEIEQLKPVITDQKLTGYGFRAGFHPKGIDIGLSWFDGYDPMPGIKLSSAALDLSGPLPAVSVKLKVTPYKTRCAAIDFETTAGAFGIRGEAAWSRPYNISPENEYIPLEEVRWVAGSDYNPGNWRIIVEYSGKYLPDFIPLSALPLIGTEPDYEQLALLLQQPGFDFPGYLKQQTSAFNRLYNYQMHRIYHSTGIRIEHELAWGRVIPSLFAMYNLTSRDLLMIPEIKFRPFDGLTVTAGAEIYSGKEGSLYRLINDFMESIYMGIRINF